MALQVESGGHGQRGELRFEIGWRVADHAGRQRSMYGEGQLAARQVHVEEADSLAGAAGWCAGYCEGVSVRNAEAASG